MELAEKIEALLEKYFEATTTLEEEQVLKDYFTSNDVAGHLQQYTMLFVGFSAGATEIYEPEFKVPKRRFNYKKFAVAAAVVLFAGTIGWFEIQRQEKIEAQQAYQDTIEALELLSNKFNKGAQRVAHLGEFERTKNQIFKK